MSMGSGEPESGRLLLGEAASERFGAKCFSGVEIYMPIYIYILHSLSRSRLCLLPFRFSAAESTRPPQRWKRTSTRPRPPCNGSRAHHEETAIVESTRPAVETAAGTAGTAGTDLRGLAVGISFFFFWGGAGLVLGREPPRVCLGMGGRGCSDAPHTPQAPITRRVALSVCIYIYI